MAGIRSLSQGTPSPFFLSKRAAEKKFRKVSNFFLNLPLVVVAGMSAEKKAPAGSNRTSLLTKK